MLNYNGTTGLPYGCVAVNRLDGFVAEELFELALAATWAAEAERVSQYTVGVAAEMEGFECDEPSGEVTLDGVTGAFTWLGGAPLFISYNGPKESVRAYCSPCVPGAADLDSGEGSIDCHGIPESWRAEVRA